MIARLLLAAGIVASAALGITTISGTPSPAPQQPAQISEPAYFVGGYQCPADLTHEACQAELDR